MMNIRAVFLAALLGAPLVASAGLAADTGDPSLVNAAKRGDSEAIESLLRSRTKRDVAGPEWGIRFNADTDSRARRTAIR
jgi:hypothetical protein